MKKESLKALTNAHAWVGLVISTVLFIVFLGGSFSLFRDNIVAWERDTRFSQNVSEDVIGIDSVVSTIDSKFDVDMHHVFFMRLPQQQKPYYEVYFAVEGPNGEEIDHNYVVSSETGEILSTASDFTFGDFLYRLHVDLKIPEVGRYIVGLVTLFFFVAIISGIVIHWRKIIDSFFKYRKDGKKDKWLDAHNLIGVMGLPFHAMYAFTGLVFNLVIVYQIAYALALYQGDQTALLADAGYKDIHLDEVNRPQNMTGFDDLHARAKESLGSVEFNYVRVEHFGDESSSVTFAGDDPSHFSTEKEIQFHIKTGDVLYKTLNNHDNDVRSGLSVIASLHFGDFAGYGLRVLFFILGIGTCYIILTGNLMWIEKRVKNKRANKAGLKVVKAMTTGGFIGALLATGVGFVCARVFPETLSDRSLTIHYVCYTVFTLAFLVALVVNNHRQLSIGMLKLTAIIMLCVPVLDWIIFAENITEMVSQGRFDVLVVQSIVSIFALCCWTIAQQMSKQPEGETASVVEEDYSLAEV